MLQRARVLFNLGLKVDGQALQSKAEENPFEMTEDERRVNYEKIKALKNPNDDLMEGTTIPFAPADASQPRLSNFSVPMRLGSPMEKSSSSGVSSLELKISQRKSHFTRASYKIKTAIHALFSSWLVSHTWRVKVLNLFEST